MKKTLTVLGAAGALLAGCGHARVSTNPQVQRDEAAAQKIVSGCLSRYHSFGQIKRCIIPPGHSAAAESCVAKALISDKAITSGQRKRFYQDLAVCAESNR